MPNTVLDGMRRLDHGLGGPGRICVQAPSLGRYANGQRATNTICGLDELVQDEFGLWAVVPCTVLDGGGAQTTGSGDRVGFAVGWPAHWVGVS